MNYAGYLTDGTMFDSNMLEVAEKFDMVDQRRKDANQYLPSKSLYSKDAPLVPGFREGLLLMSVGDKITLFIPSHLGYGARGAGGVIPPNADIIFELELVEIVK